MGVNGTAWRSAKASLRAHARSPSKACRNRSLPSADNGGAATPDGGQTKTGRFGRFEIPCDEPEGIGGTDTAPPPLAYFAASLAFWLLIQLARSSDARRDELTAVSMRITPQFAQSGSIKAGTVRSRLLDVETELDITSSAPDDDVRELVRVTEHTCFMMDAICEPHAVEASILDGESIGG